jgi:hypothetical protein
MALAGLPILAAVLTYNLARNGGVLAFGYQKANAGLHGLGFGLGGFVYYNDAGQAVRKTEIFTLRDGVTSEDVISRASAMYPATPTAINGTRAR